MGLTRKQMMAAMMSSGGGSVTPVLPYDAEIEYLGSSGAQYIDTGISMSSTIKVETKAQFTDTSNTASVTLIGASTDNSSDFSVLVGLKANGGQLYAQIGSGAISSYATPSAMHTFTTWLSGGGTTYFDVDGTTLSITTSSYSPFQLYLFARDNSGAAGNFASAKMYYCKIWSSDNLIFDAIPVRIGRVGYMYDKISGRLCRNGGAGNFTLGNDKVTSTTTDRTPIEYLQTTGSQYINTGIVQTSRNFEVRMRYQWTGATAGNFESFFAYMKDGGTTPRSGFHKYQSKWMFGTNATNKPDVAVDNNVHDLFWTSNESTQKEELYIDSTKVYEGTSTDISSNTIPFLLGGRNRLTSVDNQASMKIMSLNYKVFSDAAHATLTEEYNFVPYRVGQTGHMYETIGGIFYSNSGSGSFTLGNDI